MVQEKLFLTFLHLSSQKLRFLKSFWLIPFDKKIYKEVATYVALYNAV